MKKLISIAILTATTLTAQAKTGSEGGFERLKSNVENSKANLEDYKKNLSIVEGNLIEVGKARSAADEQKRKITAAVKENKGALSQIESQEKELGHLIEAEKNQISAEDKKLADLEALISRIKDNRQKRENNIQSYQAQIQTLQAEKQAWQSKSMALKEQETQTASRSRELTTMENEWRNKKKGYEGEVGRWSKEVEKQEKNLAQFEALADAKK